MKILVVGLGSMGKRRVRNLRALGVEHIAGVEAREDRRTGDIPTFASLEEGIREFAPTALVISTPPQAHMDVAFVGFEHRLPCFIEASVVEPDRILEMHGVACDGPVIVPSCTMRYFAGPKTVKSLIRQGAIGRVLSVNYHTGQYLPDWHPWERIQDFYVSNRATGACREIVPFELTWLNDIFGEPEPISCARAHTSIEADIDDIYHAVLRYPGGVLLNLTIDVLSRPATRRLCALGTDGKLIFDAEENVVRYSRGSEWTRIELARGNSANGSINPEEPYIDEMRDYLAAVASNDPRRFPNSLMDDYRVLKVLDRLDEMSA